MCGISGIISKNFEDQPSFERAAKLLTHRGPDFFGKQVGEEAVFFHNRLSIIDLSSNSNQPFSKEQYTLVYNGEIYNYQELYRKYFNKESYSDTEALFDLLALKGKAIIPELNGMFAFLFYDSNQRKALFARDRLGIKPLYYFQLKEAFYYSSEIKVLLEFEQLLLPEADWSTRNLKSEAIDDLVVGGHLEFGLLPYPRIKEMNPGNYGEFDLATNKLSTTSYFDIPEKIKSGSAILNKKESELTEQLDQLLHKSIAAHLISDAKVGTLCSGGLDSSLVTALALQYNKQIAIYHAGEKNVPGEERYAEMVAKHLDVELNYIRMDARSYWTTLPEAIYKSDLPIYHPSDLSLYHISKKAQDQEMKVLLSGEGADELFGGYSWHRNFKNQLYKSKIKTYLHHLIFRISKRLTKMELVTDQDTFIDLTPSYLNYFPTQFYPYARRNSIVRNKKAHRFFSNVLDGYKALWPDDKQTAALAAFITNNLGGHLSTILHRSDRMCMMASIEARVPFLENELIDFALKLHPKHKVKGKETKYILKKVAERYLPREVIYRPKMGFPVSWDKYLEFFNTDLLKDGFICDCLELTYAQIQKFTHQNVAILYTFISLEVWGRIFIHGESVEAIKKKILR